MQFTIVHCFNSYYPHKLINKNNYPDKRLDSMFHEISHLRQSSRSQVKRWFTSRDMDLFVWFRKTEPVRFQLCYNKQNSEKAISWDFHCGFRHYRVDSGETNPDQHKQTPLLIDLCDQQNLAVIARDFLAACEYIDIGLTDFIYARLMEHPSRPVQHDASHIDHR